METVPSLAALAHEVRLERCGPTVEVEGILSAKTGGCPEDCHFCSQSSQFESPVRPTAILDLNEIRAAAQETARIGASEFCIVAAVRGPDDKLIERVLEATDIVRSETGLNVAASLGILTRDQAFRLAEGGVHRYNHNLETSRSYFPRDRYDPQLGGAFRYLPARAGNRHGVVLRNVAGHGRDR